MARAGHERLLVRFDDGAGVGAALLGGKGANLAELVAMGVPVPPGFVLTTSACRAYHESGELPAQVREGMRAELARLGEATGLGFGDPARPLLVSVRSGAPASMPGMMDTVLNVGLGERTAAGFAEWIGAAAEAACRERLRSTLIELTGAAPEGPWEQLDRAVVAVFESWNSRRAKLYRRFHKIADTGTAVVVQAMAFGNAGSRSGTGVVFSRDPASGEPGLYGEYLAGGQGEDVVDGSRNVDDIAALAAAEPAAHAELAAVAARQEGRLRDMCELEFTLERGKLWILQVRVGQRTPAAALRIAVDLAEEGLIERGEAVDRVDLEAVEAALRPRLDPAALAPDAVLTTAIGSAPGLATGVVALEPAEAVRLAEENRPAILVRAETTPRDLDGMLACDGLLTSRGGRTSHAAVVARGLGKVCVCGAEDVVIDPEAGTVRVGATTLRAGEEISLDGDGGRVIRGVAPALAPAAPPQLGQLRDWRDTRKGNA
jgi:pyruvate,orthophosphate dikinase